MQKTIGIMAAIALGSADSIIRILSHGNCENKGEFLLYVKEREQAGIPHISLTAASFLHIMEAKIKEIL